MAIVAKSFKHTPPEADDIDNTAAGLAKDIEDWITANGGTIDGTSNLNISQIAVGVNIFTLVVIDNNA